MTTQESTLDGSSPEQVALGRAWAATRREAGPRLETIQRREGPDLDVFAEPIEVARQASAVRHDR